MSTLRKHVLLTTKFVSSLIRRRSVKVLIPKAGFRSERGLPRNGILFSVMRGVTVASTVNVDTGIITH